jgi:AcrR family transcriptional regulator
VIARRGYTGATMDEIAKEAGVGKDTLYRRWSSKEPLVVDLLDAWERHAVQPARLEHDPHYNLFVHLKDVVRLFRNTDFGDLVAGVVGASARNDELAVPFRAFWARRRRLAEPLVRDIAGAVGDDHIEVLLDRLFGPVYYRLLLTGASVDDEYLWGLVTSVPWSIAEQEATTPHPDADLVGAGLREDPRP